MFFFFFLMIRRPPRSTPFPTRRSSDLGEHQLGPLWKRAGILVELEHPRPRGEWLQHRVRQAPLGRLDVDRSEEHTSELQSRQYLVCRLLLEKKNIRIHDENTTQHN